MMPVVQYRPEVESDLREAANWYEEKRSGLGDEFLSEFWSAMDSVRQGPLSFAKTDVQIRAARLKRFPYVIYFSCSEDLERIVVYAVMFGGRDTSAWIDRV